MSFGLQKPHALFSTPFFAFTQLPQTIYLNLGSGDFPQKASGELTFQYVRYPGSEQLLNTTWEPFHEGDTSQGSQD